MAKADEILQDEGFVDREVETPRRSRKKKIVLKMDDNGGIDWGATGDDDKQILIAAAPNDPDILEAVAAGLQGGEGGPVVSDTMVMSVVNTFFAAEAATIVFAGPKIVPILAHIKLPVALKACTVSRAEMEPVMEPAKRVIGKYTPARLLAFQDELALLEHLGKISMAKFNACIQLALEINNRLRQQEEAKKHPPSSAPIEFPNPNKTHEPSASEAQPMAAAAAVGAAGFAHHGAEPEHDPEIEDRP